MRRALPSALSIAAAMLLCFGGVAIAGSGLSTAGDAFIAMTWGALGDWPRFLSDPDSLGLLLRPLGESATKASFLTLTGLSVAVAFRVGLFNIGAQGQLMVGALVAAVVGAKVELPAPLHIPLCLCAAAIGGALYALGPAILKVRRGVHEVISTIMLNWLAVALIENWLVVGPLRAQATGDNSLSGTAQIAITAELPRLFGDLSRLNLGVVIAVVCAVVTWWYFSRFTRGFEWRVVGLSGAAAQSAGIDVDRTVRDAMLLAGAFAGLGGALLVMGPELKYPATLAAQYGFDGIAMALLGQGNPLGVLLSSLFFGALRAGGTRMQLFGVHKSFPELIQGVALLLVAAKLFWETLVARLLPLKPKARPTPMVDERVKS